MVKIFRENKVIVVFILVLMLVSCDWLNEEKVVGNDTTSKVDDPSEVNGCDLGPDSPHYVIGYYDMSENLLDPGVLIVDGYIDIDGNEGARWSVNDPRIVSNVHHSNINILPFFHYGLFYESLLELLIDGYYFEYSFSELSESTEGFDEIAAHYNDIDYNHNNYFNGNCAKDPITGIHIYVEPSYREGYEGLPIDDLVEIQFSTAREFIENGYSYDGIEDQFPSVNGNKKITLDEFNDRENYLVGMDTMTFRLKEAPAVTGDYTFTLVYQDRDENGENEFRVDIGPIPILGEE